MTDPHAGARLWRSLRDEVARAVVGGEEPLRLLTVALLAEGHALLEDVPGVGKTLAGARLRPRARARLRPRPGHARPAALRRHRLERPGRRLAFRFIPGPIFTNVLLVDEINRATPRTQSALLEAMQERQVTVDGETRPIPAPFLVLATQNPIELEGTFPLPEAQLDRFLVRIVAGLSRRGGRASRSRAATATAHEPLDAVARRGRRAGPAGDARRDARGDGQRRGRGLPRAHRARDARARRPPARRQPARQRRALPRGAGARALDGRDFVLPDDVAALAAPVLTHRLLVDVDRELRGATAGRRDRRGPRAGLGRSRRRRRAEPRRDR